MFAQGSVMELRCATDVGTTHCTISASRNGTASETCPFHGRVSSLYNKEIRYTFFMFGLTASELRTLKALRTPEKIQNFLDTLSINFEHDGDTCMSPRSVLRKRTAHCMEGAMLAALALRVAGHKPLVLDLKVTDDDHDHVVAVFYQDGCIGAISKTNHGTLRYRDPVYKTIRELVMSYFHEYTIPNGKKILRSYSRIVDLSRFDARGWMTDENDVFYIPEYIDGVRHYPVVSKKQIKTLRPADAMERKIGAVLEWENSKNVRKN